MSLLTAWMFIGIAMVGFTASRTANATVHEPCATIDGVQQLLQAHGVFIGDMHGTEQSPAFLRNLACHVIASGRPLIIAMEYDQNDQATLDAFLKIKDEKVASQLLTDTPYWRRSTQDGRTSTAVRDALLAIRKYASGKKVEIVAYDLHGHSQTARDAASATFLTAKKLRAGPKPYWIVFGGNVHARKTQGLVAVGAPAGDEKNYQPLGYLIRDWGLIHLNALYRGGQFWGCSGEPNFTCNVRELGPPCPAGCPAHQAILLDQLDPAYDGVYSVGAMTAALPVYQP